MARWLFQWRNSVVYVTWVMTVTSQWLWACKSDIEQWQLHAGLEKVPISPWLVTLLHICGVTPTPQSLKNSAPISPVTTRDRWLRRAKRWRLRIEHWYCRIEWRVFHIILRVFHDILLVVHDVLLVIHDVLRCITMFLHVFHDVLLCLTMFYDV